MDHYAQRMFVNASDRNGLHCMGFELPDQDALDRMADHLKNAGLDVSIATDEEKSKRHIEDMIWLLDPDGNRVEFYVGLAKASEDVKYSRPIGGFRTGDLGAGHVALKTTNFPDMEHFYQTVLQFKLSDYVKKVPFRASFFHINSRHHTVAIIESDECGVHHIMIEYQFMDDVGRLYDMALQNPDDITVTLGRHSNDHMLSFYAKTPSDFMVEIGWGGRSVDDEWEPHELYGPSIWGHERSWLPPDAQEAARRQRDLAAQNGIIEPTEVVPTDAFNLRHIKP